MALWAGHPTSAFIIVLNKSEAPLQPPASGHHDYCKTTHTLDTKPFESVPGVEGSLLCDAGRWGGPFNPRFAASEEKFHKTWSEGPRHGPLQQTWKVSAWFKMQGTNYWSSLRLASLFGTDLPDVRSPRTTEWVSGGLTPCRQLRSSSQREHVNASSNHKLFIKACTAQLLSRNLKSLLAWES